jgi:hypothetical protein
MKKILFILSLVLIFALALAGTALAITNGQPDGDNHPYVGLLVFDVFVPDVGNVPAWRCSGALIAPDVVLTAGHCTEGAAAARIWFYEDVTYDNVPFPLYPYGGSGSGAVEGTPYTNPNFGSGDQGNGLPGFSKRDVGIVVLDEPVFMDAMAELPEAGLVDTLKNKTDVDLVGYGVQYQAQIPGNELPQPPPYYRWTGPRVRMYAPSALVSGNFVFSDEYMRLSMNPGGGSGGTCFGDSGGPDLLGGTDTVLAVNSFVTNINCAGNGYSSRVDIPEVLDWIYEFMP